MRRRADLRTYLPTPPDRTIDPSCRFRRAGLGHGTVSSGRATGQVGFRVGLIYTRFSGMPQAMWAALREDRHDVIRPEDLGIATPMSPDGMREFASLADPDVFFCPFLKEVVPPEVCERWTTWIPHPGIRGDRGPSSLSWAILDQERTWGLTMVRAEPSTTAEDLDSGNVGAWRVFSMPAEATMAEVYAQHVVPLAIDCAREILGRMATDPGYVGVALAATYGRSISGRHRPALRQDQLAFSWDDHPDEILRRVRAAAFGVRARAGRPAGERLRRAPPPRAERRVPSREDPRAPRRRRAGRRGRRPCDLDRARQGQVRRRRPGAEAAGGPCRRVEPEGQARERPAARHAP